MITFTFFKMGVAAKKSGLKHPDIGEAIRSSRKALLDGEPGSALGLVAPFLRDDDALPEIRLIAGRALTALGRYPEALEYFDIYLTDNADSVEGLLAAGVAASKSRALAKALGWFSKAFNTLARKADKFIQPLLSSDEIDPVIIEEMIADMESHPADKNRAIALMCALGKAGHFNAVEKFMKILDKPYEPAPKNEIPTR